MTAHAAPTLPPPVPPHRLRLTLLMTLAVYPLITGLLAVIGPLTASWPIWQRTMVLTPIMVTTILYVILPLVLRNFSGFLRRA